MGNVSFHMPITVAMGKILLVKAISAYGQGLVFISDIVWITYCSLWQFLYILTKTLFFLAVLYIWVKYFRYGLFMLGQSGVSCGRYCSFG